MIPPKLIEQAKLAQSVTVLTGAGISAESGVPTFRGEEGLWKKFRPEELANFDVFMRNPELVWEWYNYRRKIIEEISPNPGHFALAKMESHFPQFTLITQNVDGLHQSAGSSNVVELHGNIHRNRCVKCDRIFSEIALSTDEEIPTCECGGLLRPDVVWFGESLPEDVLQKAFDVTKNCDLFFSIGTSAVVYPAASLPELAKQHGAFVVEINLEPTPITSFADVAIHDKSGVILPQIVKTLCES